MNPPVADAGTRRGALALCAGVLAMLGSLGGAAALDDALYRALAAPAAAAPVVVVGIDGADAWPNGRTADLIEQLQAAGVRGIALGLPLHSQPGDPEGDARLARDLLDSRMVLGVALQAQARGRPRALMPPVEFADAARLGHLLLAVDRDGRIREHLPHVITTDGIRWPSLALALVRSGDAVGAGRLETPERWRVAYGGDAPVPRTLRASDVLRRRDAASVLGDRWVLVGLADPAQQARIPGPYGSPALYPIEHEARALAALLQDRVAAPLPAAAQALLSLLLAGGAVFAGGAAPRRSGRMPAALLAGIALALVLAAGLLHWQRWFGPGGVILVLGAALAGCTVHGLRLRLRERRGLPGLATRRRLASAVHALRAAGTPHALLLLDLPAATAPPREFGDHAARITRLLQARARRPGDLAAYLGGGRFALLLPDTAAPAAERILEELRQQATADGGATLRLAASAHACASAGCDCLGHLARSRGAPPASSAGQPAR